MGRFANTTFPVTYDDAELADVERKLIDLIFPLITLPDGMHLTDDAIVEFMTELSIMLAVHVARLSLFYKHPAYSHEQEYRLLHLHRADLPAPEVKIRTRESAQVRYREFDWRASAPDALNRIVVGPAADKDKAVQFVQGCLHAHRRDVKITMSKIPYRAA